MQMFFKTNIGRNLAIFLGVVVVAFLSTFPNPRKSSVISHESSVGNQSISVGTLPAGAQTYEIASSEDLHPRFVSTTIDPLDVHPGDTQKMKVIVEDTVDVQSVMAEIETDNGINKVELKRVSASPVTEADFNNQKYAVVDGKLAILDNDNYDYDDNFPMLHASRFMPNEASAASLARYTFEGEWLVKDTHSETYHTKFIAKNVNGDTNSITLAWTDPCTPAYRGNWTLDGNCTVASAGGVDGIANGNITVSNSSYTMTVNGTFVFYPGYSITITSGQIAVNTNGQIRQTNLWIVDADKDGYGTGTKVAQDSTPGSNYTDQSLDPTQTSSLKITPTGASLGTGGTQAWSTPTNITNSDNAYATVALNWQTSRYLQASNFGFAVPSTAIIDGVKVEIENNKTAGNISDDATYGVKLVKGGTVQGNNNRSFANWPTTDAYTTYGSNSDKWGLTLTPTDVNASNFGVAISATAFLSSGTARIDHIRITVYYHNPGVAVMGDCNDNDATKWQNLTGYVDGDGDGYGAGSSVQACSGSTLAAGYADNADDCYDNNGQAFPGQSSYFTSNRGDGSFDYDCNGSEDKEWPDTTTFACDWSYPSCGGYSGSPGWWNVPPSCGQSDSYITAASCINYDEGQWCIEMDDDETRTQACH
jgi:hypothetical protein